MQNGIKRTEKARQRGEYMQATKLRKATFKHIEAELYSLGDYTKEASDLDKEIEGRREHPEKLRYSPMIGYAKRLRWIEQLLQAILLIKSKVDLRTRTFIDLRYFEKMSFLEIAYKVEIPLKEQKNLHKLIVDTVIEMLGMDRGITTEKIEDSRYIPAEVRLQVKIRDKNCCVKCGTRKKLHIHHIEPYSLGGLNELENLMLLCASCHAEEHKGEKAYHMLKKMAE